MSAITRRTTLRVAAVSAATFTTRKARAASEPDVIVVGAGLAGLCAATLLEGQGLKFLVLEGRERVGWRVYTLYNLPSQPSRMPGEIANPLGRIHFAGEYTALTNRGMEGAMESGERAALEVLGGM